MILSFADYVVNCLIFIHIKYAIFLLDIMLDRLYNVHIMNKLSTEKRRQVVSALVEGNGIRATVRMTGVSKNTIAKLLVDLGSACSNYLNKALVNLNCKRIQCDEIWSFVYRSEEHTS